MREQLFVALVVDEQSADTPRVYRAVCCEVDLRDCLREALKVDLESHEMLAVFEWTYENGIRTVSLPTITEFVDYMSTGRTAEERLLCRRVVLDSLRNYHREERNYIHLTPTR